MSAKTKLHEINVSSLVVLPAPIHRAIAVHSSLSLSLRPFEPSPVRFKRQRKRPYSPLSLAFPTMETFSLLKYWRGGGAAAASPAGAIPGRTTTISSSVLSPTVSSSLSDSEEEGSFFDLEFAVQDESELSATEIHLSSASDLDLLQSDPVSPSTEMFFKGNSIVISSDPDTKPISQFPVSLLKSATKMRVFLLGLAKSRPGLSDSSPVSTIASPKPKFLIVSMFSRDAGGKQQTKSSKEEATVTAEEKKFAKEVVLKYLNKFRPLYVRVSKRYGDKLRFSTGEGDETDAETEATVVEPPVAPPAPSAPSPAKKSDVSDSDANHPVVVACGVRAPRASMPAGIKQVYKRLGKSRSASAAAPPAKAAEPVALQRRDDSLLQQEDGIQSAIAHCKRSFNSPSSSSSGSDSPLQRSMSDPGDGRLDKATEENSV
ncbi:hypothetical protein LUZ60_010053 [Juncus effusus]|nr:hypothetical protein LUZ60_010053 [Juncus effusus]